MAYSGPNKLSYGVYPGLALTLVNKRAKSGLVLGCVSGLVDDAFVVVAAPEEEENVGVKGLAMVASLVIGPPGPSTNAPEGPKLSSGLNDDGALSGLAGLDKGVNADDGCELLSEEAPKPDRD